jgi:site-specific recombinase XerD
LKRLEAHLGRRTLRSITPTALEEFRRDELQRIRDRQAARHALALTRTERALAGLKADEHEQRERLQAALSHLQEREAQVLTAGMRTVNKCLGALRTLLKFAQARGYTLGNAATHVKKLKTPPRIDRPMDQHVLTPSELQRLIGATDPN